MSEALIASILFELLDLGIRFSNTHADVEKYLDLRRQLRKELVERANRPFTDENLAAGIRAAVADADATEPVLDEGSADPTKHPLGASDTLGSAIHSPVEVKAANNTREVVEEMKKADETTGPSQS